jgi:hypothetical protein
MTTLYRSPNVILADHEWHVHVWHRKGHVTTCYYFRPLSTRPMAWQPQSEWTGHKPKWREWNRSFGKFKMHATQAARSVVEHLRLAREAERRGSKVAAIIC